MVPSRRDDDEPLTAWICSGLSEPAARRTQSGTMPRLVLPPPPLVDEARIEPNGSSEAAHAFDDEPTLELPPPVPASVAPSSAPPSSASRTPSSRPPPASYARWRAQGARVLLGLSDNPYKKR